HFQAQLKLRPQDLEPHAQAQTDVTFRVFASGALRRVDDAEAVQIAHRSIRIELQVRYVRAARARERWPVEQVVDIELELQRLGRAEGQRAAHAQVEVQ